jgi:hypothetical protein
MRPIKSKQGSTDIVIMNAQALELSRIDYGKNNPRCELFKLFIELGIV